MSDDAEAIEQAELAVLRDLERQRSPDDVPRGWIGPMEAARLQAKVRELRAALAAATA